MIPEVRTERLLLRGWTDADRPAYAAINADPLVMAIARAGADPGREPTPSSTAWWPTGPSTATAWWCVDLDGECIGFTGLATPRDAVHARCVEVGWRLASAHWGHGYAPEAARAALAFGFDDVGLDEIVSFTTVRNAKSRRVMEKLGMTRDPDADFDHPRATAELRRHVLYRLAPPDLIPSECWLHRSARAGPPARSTRMHETLGWAGRAYVAAWTASDRSCCCCTGPT